MFITQTYKSVNWLKNQTKEGGAMEEVLMTKKEEDIAFNIILKKSVVCGEVVIILQHSS